MQETQKTTEIISWFCERGIKWQNICRMSAKRKTVKGSKIRKMQ